MSGNTTMQGIFASCDEGPLLDRDNRNRLMGKQLIIAERGQTNKLQAQLPLYVSVKKTSL